MTVLDALHPNHDPVYCRDCRTIFARAALCGKLAKLSQGRTRRKLYRFKNACIAILQVQFADEIETRGDADRHRGLLSIALRTNKRQRLHSHEAWMPAA